jgi:hypothetical protein
MKNFDYEVRFSGLGDKQDLAAVLDILTAAAKKAITLPAPYRGSNWVEQYRLIAARLRHASIDADSIRVPRLAYSEARELTGLFRYLLKTSPDCVRGTEKAEILLQGAPIQTRRIPAVGARSRKRVAIAA